MDFFARLGCTLPMVIAAIRAGYEYLPADRIIYIFYMVLAAINLGGSSMSGLALIAIDQGFDVAGSDIVSDRAL